MLACQPRHSENLFFLACFPLTLHRDFEAPDSAFLRRLPSTGFYQQTDVDFTRPVLDLQVW